MAKETSKTFDRAMVLIAIFAVLTAALALIAAVRSGGDTPGGADGGGGSSTESTQPTEAVTANLELKEWAIEGDLTVPPGALTLEITNSGSMIHNLVFEDGTRSVDLNPGETTTLEVGELPPGTYTVFCDIAGHRAAGMESFLVVTGIPPEGGEGAGSGGHEDMSPAEMDQMMIDSMLAFPAETAGVGNVKLEPTTIEEDGTKVFDLTASVIDWEVSPGEFVEAWAYNEMVPGPWIHLDVGDNVKINVTNETTLSTDVHWHGIPTPNEMDGVTPYTQDPIRPGETFTYEFGAVRTSLGMYHAHLHSQISVPNGMFALFTIGDLPLPLGETISGVTIPEDLEVAQEIPMVLNDAGVIGLSLNGKSFPGTAPYVANQGDWLVYHYYNEGLQIHPMHQHQFPQLVFAKDGIPLEQPYWADTVNIAPGERYSVLLNPDEPGTWVWHCHILTHVEDDEGMFGMVTALIVQPTEEG